MRATCKWEGERRTLLDVVDGCWIPHSDLLEALNAFPGAALTMADLKATMVDSDIGDGDPDLQADCLRVYRREKRAGTDIRAIPSVIYDEVIGPVDDRQRAEHAAAWHAKRQERVRAGKDFGLQYRLDDSGDAYMRHLGQLYRITRLAPNNYKIFCVSNIGELGEPEPHTSQLTREARSQILFGVKPRKGGQR